MNHCPRAARETLRAASRTRSGTGTSGGVQPRPRAFIFPSGNMKPMSPYTAMAEPHRRQILDLLRDGERPAGELVERLALSQPGVSKHLKVLREAGLVAVRP